MTPEDRQRVAALYQEGASTPAIATMLGVTHQTVRRSLIRQGIPRRPPGHPPGAPGKKKSVSEHDLHRLLVVEGRSIRDTAAALGVASGTVTSRARQAGIALPTAWQSRRGGAVPALPAAQEFRRLYADGASLTSIGDRYGVSTTTVVRLAREYGVTVRPAGYSGRQHHCSDGHTVRSTYESRVCEWLTAEGVTHDYEPPIGGTRFTADFLANGWYIEIWGVQRSPRYEERRARKTAAYAERGLPLLELRDYHFSPSHGEPWRRRLRAVYE